MSKESSRGPVNSPAWVELESATFRESAHHCPRRQFRSYDNECRVSVARMPPYADNRMEFQHSILQNTQACY